MARQASILIFSADTPVKITGLAATTASSLQVVGKNRIIAINADQDITILFSAATSATTTASTTSYRIPANQQTTIDTGQAFTQFSVFNNTASPANIYYQTLTVV
jgi:hypothetical protein